MKTVWCVFNEWYLDDDDNEDPHKDLLAIFENPIDALRFAIESAEQSVLDDESETVTPIDNKEFEGFQVSCSSPSSFDWFYIEEKEVRHYG